MTSPLPPRRRDTRSLADRLRQDRQNLAQLGVGFVGGRFPPARPLGATEQLGDIEDDTSTDEETEQIAFRNTDRAVATAAGVITLRLAFTPVDGSLHVRWNGLDQPPTDWMLAGQVVTFAEPHVHVGDVLTAAYAYYPSDTTPPEITSPTEGTSTTDSTPTITGTGTDGQTITVYVDGVSVGAAVVAGGEWSLVSTALSSGSHEVYAVDEDAQESTTVTFTIIADFATYMAALEPSWWGRLGDAPSSSIAVDSSGNGHDGTATVVGFGATGLVAGDPDTSATWIAPGRVEVTYGSWMDGPVISTFNLFKTTSTDANGIVLISRWNFLNGQVFKLDVVNGALRLCMGPGFLGSTTITVSGLGLNDGNKHMAGFTYDGSTVNLYTDAGLVHSEAVSRATTAVNTTLLVGADRGGGAGSLLHHFVGTLDEPAFWSDRIVTVAEYADLWSLAA